MPLFALFVRSGGREIDERRAWRRDWRRTALAIVALVGVLVVLGSRIARDVGSGGQSASTVVTILIVSAVILCALAVVALRRERERTARDGAGYETLVALSPVGTVQRVSLVDEVAKASRGAAKRAPRGYTLTVDEDDVVLTRLGDGETIARIARDELTVRVRHVSMGVIRDRVTLELSGPEAHAHVMVEPDSGPEPTERRALAAHDRVVRALGHDPVALELDRP